ncbi:E3 ubiquitin-protein ligase TRIM39-like [Aulostomus maculatus]
MAAATCLLSGDQFLCSICLDVLTQPVTLSCGHNFCKDCITTQWDSRVTWLCPMCKQVFAQQPELQVNSLISEIIAHFREAQQKASGSERHVSRPGEVQCDICTGTKLRALKSCQVCLVSCCETHLGPHLTVQGLKRHQLIDPEETLEDRMCTKQDKPLELLCRDEYEKKKVELGKTEAGIQQMIQERRLKIKEIQYSVDLSEADAKRETGDGVQVFTALQESVARSLDELLETIEEKRRRTKNQAEDMIRELQQEISVLMERSSEVEQLSGSEDHLHLLQSFPATKDWTDVLARPPSCKGAVVRAKKRLTQTMRKLFAAVEMKRFQQYEVDVTFDPDTAHPNLFLSDDRKQVSHVNLKKNLPDTPKRFSKSVSVFGKKGFSSGRFYFEVQVEGKTKWTVGVARESINRKENVPFSRHQGYWTLCLRNGNKYKACDDPAVCLPPSSRPKLLGVLVDYEEGLVSFYNVNTADLICSLIHCNFAEKLHPYFSPCPNDGGENTAPLILAPVRAATM